MYKGYLKLIVLSIIQKENSSGYSLIKKLKEQLGKSPSPGSIYPLLNELEIDKLIKKKPEGKKNIYSMTLKGKTYFKKLELEKRSFSKVGMKIVESVYNMTKDADLKEVITKPLSGDFCKTVNYDIINLKKDIYLFHQDENYKKFQKDYDKIIKDTSKKLKDLRKKMKIQANK